MANGSIEQQKVETVIREFPQAGDLLHSYGIDRTSRFSLAQAATMAGAEPTAVMAELEFRKNQIARQLQRERR